MHMRNQGIIKNVSLGMNDSTYALQILKGKPDNTFDSVMLAGSWNLMDQGGLELLSECQRRGIKVHNAGIFASGLLVGGSHYKYASANSEILERRDRWTKLALKHNVSLPAVAIAFSLLYTVIEKIAVGVKSAKEVRAVTEWLVSASTVPSKIWHEAKREGLLAENVLVPSM